MTDSDLPRHPSLTNSMPDHISLREWAERLELAVSGTDLGVWDWYIQTGEVYFNRQWSEMLGYEAGEIEPGYESWARIVHPDDLPRVEEALRAHIRGDVPDYEAEHRLLARDGSWRWVLTKGRVVQRDQEGQALRAVGTHRDIHRTKMLEEKLRDSESRLRSLIENSPQPVAVTTDGRVAYLNPAAESLLGWDEGEMLDKSPIEFIHPDDRHKLGGRLQRAARGEAVGPSIYRVMRKSGSHVEVETETRPLTFMGNPSTITSFHDLTRRHQARKQLEEYQHRLRSLTSELALTEERERRRIASDLHDGPVQSLGLLKIKLGALEAAAEHAEIRELVQEARGIADTALRDARSLLFELSPPVLYELGLPAAVEWLAERLSTQFEIRVEVTSRGALPDLNQNQQVVLFQLVRELITNVGKHADARRAEVVLDSFEGKTRISVSDDGRGFEESQDAGTEESGGYGLFSVRERVDLLGGTLRIDTTPGGGTRVILWV